MTQTPREPWRRRRSARLYDTEPRMDMRVTGEKMHPPPDVLRRETVHDRTCLGCGFHVCGCKRKFAGARDVVVALHTAKPERPGEHVYEQMVVRPGEDAVFEAAGPETVKITHYSLWFFEPETFLVNAAGGQPGMLFDFVTMSDGITLTVHVLQDSEESMRRQLDRGPGADPKQT